jgi:8-oxo-dGTP diphosphatase
MAAPNLSGWFAELDRDYLPHLSVNCVILGFHAGELKVLLLRWALPGPGLDAWGLPGGYVRKDEHLDQAAARVLSQGTGLEGVYLRQFHTFGGTDRGERATIVAYRALGADPPFDHWAVSRVVSVGYFALVDFTRARVTHDALAREHGWWHVADRPRLMFDHDEMIEHALGALRMQLDYLPLGESLLSAKFTMPELQRLYETVHGRQFDRRNFQKRMLDLGLVKRLREQRTGGARPPSYLYRWVGRNGTE